ncbi:cyclin-domain-containing protein [Delitschia confertaspora ATCC 74209]|uniref:Cyclin-domain-containing protein n=1 Tax=Delitschia confertaspora ATCC 74209 TaxID=1513339 RepID=A0A9P4JNM4_9PLEO|nr:cyclin-domain-containing protein [Delitschia confertaspora ATCC 74209]
MGSIVLGDIGGHHFQNTMFGANSTHPPQERSSTHHTTTSSRPSPQITSNPPIPVATPGDTTMTESEPAPSHTATPGHQSRQQSNSEPSPSGFNAAQQSQQPPPSPRFRPHQPQQAPLLSGPAPNTLTNSRPVPSSASSSTQQSPISSLRSPLDSVAASPRRIKVKSLSHIQSFATDEMSPFSQTRSLSRRQRRDPNDIGPQYEISEMPVSDIIEMVAGLLTKITTTNDRQHEHLHRQIPPPEGTTGLSQQTTSVLAFHGKNVPSISILSYLSRIHKYCPTTYEVFLSLLVYFDRMTERVNSGPMQSLRQANQKSFVERASGDSDVNHHSSTSAATLDDNSSSQVTTESAQEAALGPSRSQGKSAKTPTGEDQSFQEDNSLTGSDPYNLSHFFVVDSFNIHRLVIAGVTCASKFFSDVFYTNSRYAKVGGLPLVELNHLELQFLLLNDFRLAVPLEEMEAYGTMLVEFYAREVVAQQHTHQASTNNRPHTGHHVVASA